MKISRLVIFCLICSFVNSVLGMFTLNKNDPAPIFSTIYPYFYLYNKQNTFQLPCPDPCVDNLDYRWQFAVTPFYQRSNKGSNFCECCTELGDLIGRPNLLAILPFNDEPSSSGSPLSDYTDIPYDLLVINSDGKVTASRAPEYLYEIRDNLLSCIEDIGISDEPEQLQSIEGLLSLQTYVPNFGTFSVPIKYRKAGFRFQLSFMFSRSIGFNFQLGVANISQCPKFISQNYYCPKEPCTANVCEVQNCDDATINPLVCRNPLANQITQEQWQSVVSCTETDLMGNLRPIADAINLDVCNFSKTSIEDIHGEIFIRQGYEFGDPYDCRCWSNVLLVPFLSVGGSIATSPKKNQNVLFALPNGNDGHNSVDFRGGFSASFKRTIEATVEGGFTHFFSRMSNNYRVPTNDFQRFIYPYSSVARINPGSTWHIGLAMNAYHFIDNLTFWAQYLFVNHDPDRICILENNENGAFKPEKLECLTAWKNNLGTVAFNYDFTPEISLGCLWQFSMKRANAYNNNTFLISLILSGLSCFCD